MKRHKVKSGNKLPEQGLKASLIICNGKLGKKLIQNFVKLNKSLKQNIIIAADGASDFLYKHKIIPDYIIGDLDSISPAALKYFSGKNVKIKKIRNQNKNDLEKCIQFCINEKLKRIIIVGIAGNRLDHTINNLSILKKYSGKADIKCYNNEFEFFFIKKKVEFTCKIGDVISLIALPKARGITTKGLKYPLKNGTLEFGGMQGALNNAAKKNVIIEVKKGHLLLLKKHSDEF